jgi:aminoglycoside 6'-N-acetyltransferase
VHAAVVSVPPDPTSDARLHGSKVVLVPTDPAHVERLLAIRAHPIVAARWGEPEPGWPFTDADVVPWTIQHAGAVIGFVHYGEETDPDYRSASLDIFLDPALHGRGFASDAIRTLVEHLTVRHGHHRLTIDPAADNYAAIRCYAAAGFRPVGVMHRYERGADGTWHDGLLMEFVTDV